MPTLISFLVVWMCLGPSVEGFIIGFPWTEWSACSRSCGGGDHSRTYNCNVLNHFTMDYYLCTHKPVLTIEKCNVHPCPVDGKWGDWMAWSQCSVTCGYGESMRVRVCNNPPPSNENRFCQGNDRETMSCSTARCHLDVHWGAWSTWSQCSVTCGAGTSMRSRSCVNQSSTGQSCVGTATETTSCNLTQCDVDGNWSEWSKWSGCTMTCSTGSMSRARVCNNPPPANGGHSCNGSNMQTVTCNTNACPVDGQWSEWTPYSPCDATCGTGTRSRFRICDNPRPSDDGKYCIGGSFEISSCADGLCVTPTGHVCNGSKILSTVILHTSVSHPGDHKCLVNNNHPAEAVLEEFCNAPNKQTWTFHTKVVDTCSMVSMYTPIGFLDVVADEEKYGVFMGCTQTGFKEEVVRQWVIHNGHLLTDYKLMDLKCP